MEGGQRLITATHLTTALRAAEATRVGTHDKDTARSDLTGTSSGATRFAANNYSHG